MNRRVVVLMSAALVWGCLNPSARARVKLVALPDRETTTVRLDNPRATLVEEERVLTLQKGLNQVDFSWQGVQIDPDSIRLRVLTHPERVTLLNVSYPPGEAALVWSIASDEAWEERVRISYLLQGIDRLVTYKGKADKDETRIDVKSYLVLRNFSGEDFEMARVTLDYGEAFERGIAHEETRSLLFFTADDVPIEKTFTFDAAELPWDPEKVDTNVGIPVHYVAKNDAASGLGRNALWGGKVRVHQDDGHEGTIFVGEDATAFTPVGEKMELRMGDSRDLVVTQRKMREEQVNVRRNKDGRAILFDTDELIRAEVENFKDRDAVLKLVEHVPGEWKLLECSHEYERKDVGTVEIRVPVPASGKAEVVFHYGRRNVRAGR